MKLALVLLLVAGPLGAQAGPRYEWPTELAGGALADLVARGPWMRESWRQSLARRVAFATALSVTYEICELWNGQHNAMSPSDVGQRLVGTLMTEGVVWLLRKL